MKLGTDRDTGRPTVEILKIDKTTGFKEYEVYISDSRGGWTRIHWNLENPNTGRKIGFALSRKQKGEKL